MLIGVSMASELFTFKKHQPRLGRGPFMALCTATMWGVGYGLLARALRTAPWQVASLVQLAVITITGFLCAPLIWDQEKVLQGSLRKVVHPYVFGAGLIAMFGMVIVNIGIEQDTNLAPAVAAVSACYPVLTILLALRKFREDFRQVPLGGALLTIVGVVVLSLG